MYIAFTSAAKNHICGFCVDWLHKVSSSVTIRQQNLLCSDGNRTSQSHSLASMPKYEFVTIEYVLEKL